MVQVTKLQRCSRRFFGRKRKSRRREAVGRRNSLEAVPNGKGGNGDKKRQRVLSVPAEIGASEGRESGSGGICATDGRKRRGTDARIACAAINSGDGDYWTKALLSWIITVTQGGVICHTLPRGDLLWIFGSLRSLVSLSLCLVLWGCMWH